MMIKLRIRQDPRPQPVDFLAQYQILNVVNRSAYGVVYRALDKRSGEIVAVKEEIHGMCRSTSTEIDILKTLPRHRRIVGLKNVVMGGGVFVVMEYVEYDLARLRAALSRPFQLEEIKLLMKGILEGVGFLHGERVMHRDIKPSNILFSHKNREIKICDFGLSAPFGAAGGVSFCPRVGTQWYKAPELLRGSWSYTCAVDMWAVGCVMAEMVLDQVLFPGNSEDDDEQLECIRRVINPPLNRLGMKVETVAMFQGTAELSPSGIDLLERLLAYEAEKRITAADALNHRWFHE